MGETAQECIHYWKIGVLKGGTARGICTRCGAKRNFYDTNPRGVVSVIGRRASGKKALLTKKEAPELTTEQGAVKKNISKRHRYYEEHKQEILADLASMEVGAMRRKWGIPSSTWVILRRRWEDGIASAPVKPFVSVPSRALAVGQDCEKCPFWKRLQFLEGYYSAVRDFFEIKKEEPHV